MNSLFKLKNKISNFLEPDFQANNILHNFICKKSKK